ncbi:MAG: S8 family serine peptidase [Thermoanaerobaculia bacterium]
MGVAGSIAARANLRPLFEGRGALAAPGAAPPGFGLAEAPAWFVAELETAGETGWDSAHARVADQLGIDAEAIDFVEPDLVQGMPSPQELSAREQALAAHADCTEAAQTDRGGRVKGPDRFAWHLEDAYSGLASARAAVSFSPPRTRIAHIDTGYDKNHPARPAHIAPGERNFVDADGKPNDAEDPNRGWLLDNSGHGTGTIGILAGQAVGGAIALGGAPDAEILPLRVSNSVIHLWTSAFARALEYAVAQGCDVVSASLGGLPSRAWNDAVDAAYEAGVLLVAAAGDCLSPQGLPTHHVVYPARYHRAIAACGVMANYRPYYHLTTGIEGSWGPASSMIQALSAYTPNIPWAKLGCPTAIDRDGEGTSAATPQIAAAAALWIEKYKSTLPRDWRRVEAVKFALFSSAAQPGPGFAEYLGNGTLAARQALDVAPRLDLPKTPRDKDSFAFLRVLTGLGLAAATSPREAMFDLELAQRWLANRELAEAIDDPEGEVTPEALRAFVEAAIADGGASLALRRHLAERWGLVFKAPLVDVPVAVVPKERPAFEAPRVPTPAEGERIPPPESRRIRTYAVDPSFSTRLDTFRLNEATLAVRWEKLKPGPVGEYLEVVDVDATGAKYAAVDLDYRHLLARDGLAPAEGNPRFHQQMVYAVAMTTIEHFERALGRPVQWRSRSKSADDPYDDSIFVPRLIVHPHALRAANAFYSPREIALRFGYFDAAADDPGDHVPGSAVFACLSHDIVAHETTHAVLDGMHRRFQEPSNPDVLAFHEAFADSIALMQHFALPEILEHEIARARGELAATETMLGSLALQFGRAIGGRGALREAIGRRDAQGVWRRIEPDPSDYQRITTPHERGALLVAAVFDAFLAIYGARTADLLRLATGGSGVLPAGAIHPDLVKRLAAEAGKSARHVLNLVIRAVDYLPPVDVTFGEFLRGLVTADFDLVPEDRYGYRVAFVEAFRRRGIYPRDLATLSVDTLRWRGVAIEKKPASYNRLLTRLRRYADACFYLHEDRRRLFERTRSERRALHKNLAAAFAADPGFAELLGLAPALAFEVHELHRAARLRPDGREVPQVIVGLTQDRPLAVPGAPTPQVFRGGSTLVVDLAEPEIQYAIVKHVTSEDRENRTRDFLADTYADPLKALLLAPGREEPFAVLHGWGGGETRF